MSRQIMARSRVIHEHCDWRATVLDSMPDSTAVLTDHGYIRIWPTGSLLPCGPIAWYLIHQRVFIWFILWILP